MPEASTLSKLTREELYELVWSTPATKLGEKLGVSDVAVFKRCQKLGVPRPVRGHWARLEFGKAGEKPPLPPLPPSPAEQFAQEAAKPVAKNISVQTGAGGLHPLADQFQAAIEKASLSYDKQRVHLEEKEFPGADVSKVQAKRVAKAFHALLRLVEARGILFQKSRSKYQRGRFRKETDDLELKIEEELVEKPEPAGRRNAGYPSWQREENKIPCGRLTFILYPERYGRRTAKRWMESEKTPLDTIVSEIAAEIFRHYLDLQTKREEEAVRREKERVEWEARQQEAAKRKHADTVETAVRTRQDDLLRAAEWWRIYQSVREFLDECERRWRAKQTEQLSPEQQTWLEWAREVAKGSSPFEAGYPDPDKDGAFSIEAVPFGGPYPDLRKFPQPPSMPVIPAPVVVQQGYGSSYESTPKPYPFWLKYQRR